MKLLILSKAESWSSKLGSVVMNNSLQILYLSEDLVFSFFFFLQEIIFEIFTIEKQPCN